MTPEERKFLFDSLIKQLSKAASPPLLFVGSGFSQRYLGFPSWQQLLEKFCEGIKPYNYYFSKADGDMPTVASFMAIDFFEYAWADPEKAKILKGQDLPSKESVLKFFIAKFIESEYILSAPEDSIPDEIRKLENIDVDAIITTNWDNYLEDIFPGYITYVGQDEIVVSNPHGIGEIYKIHGCIKQPSSLVLTRDDYHRFDEKYPYLAAKLITYLIEHPIVFLGYSLQDANIKSLIESLASCLGSNIHDKLRDNLIFVQRNGTGRTPGIGVTQYKVRDRHVPLTTITTDDFGVLYDAIGSIKRKIPARMLRFIKEEIYELVRDSDPDNKICVVDIDDIGSHENVEFVVGVGVHSTFNKGLKSEEATIGYKPIEIEKIFEDVLSSDDSTVFSHVDKLLSSTLPFHLSRTAYVPIFKYLRLAGITTGAQYVDSKYNLSRAYERPIERFRNSGQTYANASRDNDMSYIIQNSTPQRAAYVIPHYDRSEIDIKELKAFLMVYKEHWINPKSTYCSAFRKLIALYDRYKFGWIDK